MAFSLDDFYLNRVIPTIFDESLSYYETLRKLIVAINDVITEYNDMSEQLAQLKIWIDNQLENYTKEQLNEWNTNGTLNSIINETLFNGLNSNLSPFSDFPTTKTRLLDTNCYITVIPKAKANWQIGIANSQESFPITLQKTSEIAKEKNASICINASQWNPTNNSFWGILIKNGVVIANADFSEDSNLYVLCFDSENNMHLEQTKYTTVDALLAKGYKNCLQGFYAIIKDGTKVIPTQPNFNPVNCIGQRANGDFVLLQSDGRTNENKGLDSDGIYTIMQAQGCINAYQLDGGGSTSLVNRLVMQNQMTDTNGTEERKVFTTLYISENPNSKNGISNAFSELNNVKEQLRKETRTNQFFDYGANVNGKYPIIINKKDGAPYEINIDFAFSSVFARMTIDGNKGIVFYVSDGTTLKQVANFYPNSLKVGDDGNRLEYGGNIPRKCTDCNIVIGNSVRYVQSDTLNLPADFTSSLGVIVERAFFNDLGSVEQLITIRESNVVYKRKKHAGVWTAWKTNAQPDYVNYTAKIGEHSYNATTKKPVWYDGTVWRYADGTIGALT